MTKYRIIHDGDVEWLQFEYIRQVGWWIFKWTKTSWELVRSLRWDYFDELWENHNNRYGNAHSKSQLEFRFINSRRDDIKKFAKSYPYIDIWYEMRKVWVDEKKKMYTEKRIKQNTVTIKYL